MRTNSTVCSIFLVHFATAVWSTTSFQCYPYLQVSWTFDVLNSESKFNENIDDLSSITLHLDSGFLKLPIEQDKDTVLLKQHSIIKNSGDALDIVVRYQDTNKTEIEQTGIILKDPMCKTATGTVANIFITEEFAYNNIVYKCDCVSPTYDIENFVYNR